MAPIASGCSAKRGRGYAYGWKGKGSTVHLVTEGNGLPLAFLVTAANVSEVTVGLEVLDRVKVPRPQGRPRQRPARLAADESYDSASPDSIGASQERDSAVHSKAGVEKPPPPARPTSPGASSQPESLEGRAEPRVVRQLAKIGDPVRPVKGIIHPFSDHRLLHGHSGKDSPVGNLP
jgi:hypothetical protein